MAGPYTWLQWGRVMHDAEMFWQDQDQTRKELLQWGRVMHDAEMLLQEAGRGLIQRASMGPRHA